MKMRIFATALFICLFGANLFAQDAKLKLTEAVMEINDFTDGDYVKANEFLDYAIEHEGDLKDKDVAKAYYYKGKAIMMAMARVAGEVSKMTPEQQKANQAKILKYAHPLVMLDAYKYFKLAKEKDSYNNWTQESDAEINRLINPLFNTAVQYFYMDEEKAKQMLGESMSKEQEAMVKQLTNDYALKHINAFIEIKDDFYKAYDVRGQIYHQMDKTAEAKVDFLKALELYHAKKPEKPDFGLAYAYYYMGLAAYNEDKKDAALEMASKGKKFLDAEYTRYEAGKGSMKDEEIEKFESDYMAIKGDLSKFETEILVRYPEKMDEAIAKLKEEIKNDPKNLNNYLYLGSMLEQNPDPEKKKEAITYYEKALEVDPNAFAPNYYLGTYLYNLGAETFNKMNEAEDDAKRAELDAQYKQNFNDAYGYLVKALEHRPESMEIIQALISVTTYLEMEDESLKYIRMKKELQAQ